MKKSRVCVFATIFFSAAGAFAESFDGAATVVAMPVLAQTVSSAMSATLRERVFDAFSVDALYVLLVDRKDIPGTEIEKNFPPSSDIARFARGASRAFYTTGGALSFEMDHLRSNAVIYQANYQPGDGTVYEALFAADGSVIGNFVGKTTVVGTKSLREDRLFTIGELPKASFIP